MSETDEKLRGTNGYAGVEPGSSVTFRFVYPAVSRFGARYGSSSPPYPCRAACLFLHGMLRFTDKRELGLCGRTLFWGEVLAVGHVPLKQQKKKRSIGRKIKAVVWFHRGVERRIVGACSGIAWLRCVEGSKLECSCLAGAWDGNRKPEGRRAPENGGCVM